MTLSSFNRSTSSVNSSQPFRSWRDVSNGIRRVRGAVLVSVAIVVGALAIGALAVNLDGDARHLIAIALVAGSALIVAGAVGLHGVILFAQLPDGTKGRAVLITAVMLATVSIAGKLFGLAPNLASVLGSPMTDALLSMGAAGEITSRIGSPLTAMFLLIAAVQVAKVAKAPIAAEGAMRAIAVGIGTALLFFSTRAVDDPIIQGVGEAIGAVGLVVFLSLFVRALGRLDEAIRIREANAAA